MCVDLTQKYDPKHMKNIPYTARLSPVHITSHHIEETDAGRDRPLYLRNKLYNKTLKSQNYYSNRYIRIEILKKLTGGEQ